MSDIDVRETIHDLEQQLRQAQLSSDVEALSRLIDDALLFTGPDGSLYSKSDDLALHAAKSVRFTKHEPDDLRMLELTPDIVVVSVRVQLAGEMQGQSFVGPVRYTRVWARRNDGWRIVAGHVSAVRA